MPTISARNALIALLLAFSLALSMPAVHAVISPNLAVDLISTSFSDTSVQATASGPSGTGSVVLQSNPGSLIGFDITVDVIGSLSLTTPASVNPSLCPVQTTVTNTLVLNTIHIAVACIGGGTISSGDQNLFQFGWSGSSGTVHIASQALVGIGVTGGTVPVPATTSDATVTSSSSVPEFPVGFALLFAVMVPTILLLRNVRIRK